MTENTDFITPELEEKVKHQFKMMREFYQAVFNGAIKSLVVAGPAGVGKSHSIEDIIQKQGETTGYTHSTIKGHATPLYIFEHLREHCNEKHVIIFDDCDNIFKDHDALNVLKAALDSKKTRIVTWGSTRGGDEKSFEFKGSVIFLTNMSLNKITKNEMLKSNIEALASRSHYFDLNISSIEERYVRVKQVATETQMLTDRKLDMGQIEEILKFMLEEMNTLSEISLRMLTKIADLYVYNDSKWKEMARITCCTHYK